MDMEMVQYHPTCSSNRHPDHRGARGEGAHLLNANGERFMEKAAPNKMELASRDVVSRAEQIEINEVAAVARTRRASTRRDRRAAQAHARGAARVVKPRARLRRPSTSRTNRS